MDNPIDYRPSTQMIQHLAQVEADLIATMYRKMEQPYTMRVKAYQLIAVDGPQEDFPPSFTLSVPVRI